MYLTPPYPSLQKNTFFFTSVSSIVHFLTIVVNEEKKKRMKDFNCPCLPFQKNFQQLTTTKIIKNNSEKVLEYKLRRLNKFTGIQSKQSKKKKEQYGRI